VPEPALDSFYGKLYTSYSMRGNIILAACARGWLHPVPNGAPARLLDDTVDMSVFDPVGNMKTWEAQTPSQCPIQTVRFVGCGSREACLLFIHRPTSSFPLCCHLPLSSEVQVHATEGTGRGGLFAFPYPAVAVLKNRVITLATPLAAPVLTFLLGCCVSPWKLIW
jgi:hypothetical protein